jgi:hypothetical protein
LRCCWTIPNAHSLKPAFEDLTIGTVPVANDVARCAVRTHSRSPSQA